MKFGYIATDEVFKHAVNFLEENKRNIEEISEFCIVGGCAVQYHLLNKSDKTLIKDYLRPTTDIDVLPKERIKKSDFHKLLEEINFDYKEYSIDTRITRSFFEISVNSKNDAIHIHIPYFTSKRYEENENWIKDTVENRTEIDLISVPLETVESCIKNKKRRSTYHLKKLGIFSEYFENLIEKLLLQLITKNIGKAKQPYFQKKQELANALEDDENFYSERVQTALRWTKIYKDAYDIACLKYFYPSKYL